MMTTYNTIMDALEQLADTFKGDPTAMKNQEPILASLQSILDNIAATATNPGVVELATVVEAQTGTDTQRAVTPAGLAGRTATAIRAGVVELATDAEAQTGSDTERAITPANLQAVTSTATRKGVVELAIDGEAVAGTDTARALTAANLRAVLRKIKVLSFTGKNNTGACTLVGAAVTDIVLCVTGITTVGNAATSFEAAITVADQIQQSNAGDLHLENYMVVLLAIS